MYEIRKNMKAVFGKETKTQRGWVLLLDGEVYGYYKTRKEAEAVILVNTRAA
jgi:hypothetical protein